MWCSQRPSKPVIALPLAKTAGVIPLAQGADTGVTACKAGAWSTRGALEGDSMHFEEGGEELLIPGNSKILQYSKWQHCAPLRAGLGLSVCLVLAVGRLMERTTGCGAPHGAHDGLWGASWSARRAVGRLMERTMGCGVPHEAHDGLCRASWSARWAVPRLMERTMGCAAPHGAHDGLCRASWSARWSGLEFWL
ncbi:hypothetical protein CYMTET_5108 [Cymbomonas tetramitiformis]|uniref:Uncharacterized protein n=1 Tax=Cymbomonas tetramitiformis TaxID=36881 RepID=A0AAE0H043_9CHLO|nr:hypothetical protein CYMTET_5108 [Cymbomonas tetramitiformis]